MDLQFLQKCLGLMNPPTDPSFNDTVFIAVDFECTENFARENRQCQAGIAILDTRDFGSSSQSPHISTFNFTTGSDSYYNRCKKKFLFGETIRIQKEDFHQNIEALISRERKNILVGHDIRGDLKVLKILNFDLETSIIGICDTQRLAITQGKPKHTPARLRDILRDLKCPYRNLHNAGNDAHFTLRALFLLAIRSYSDTTNLVDDDDNVNNDIQRGKSVLLLSILKEISLSSLPLSSSSSSSDSDNRIAEKNRKKKEEKAQAKERLRVAQRERRIQLHAAAFERKHAERRLRNLANDVENREFLEEEEEEGLLWCMLEL